MTNNKKAQKIKLDKKDHKALVLWAADCAEHVLPYFEKEYPKDNRPRKAIEEARSWARGDEPMKMSVIRSAALAAHAAARATENRAARAAARAAGQAVATVHVAGHAGAVVYYINKVVEAVLAGQVNIARERAWLRRKLADERFQKHLRSIGLK